MDKASFKDWKKLQLRVGKILKVERVENADKLYKLQVEVGLEKPIQIITGIVPYYSEDELLNKKIIVIINLEPAKFKGEISEGMLLAAGTKETDTCVLLTPEKDIIEGTPIT